MTQLKLGPERSADALLSREVGDVAALTQFYCDLHRAITQGPPDALLLAEIWKVVPTIPMGRVRSRVFCDFILDADAISLFFRAMRRHMENNRSKIPPLCEIWSINFCRTEAEALMVALAGR